MTDDKVVSEGPYTTGLSEGLVFKDNMVVESFDSERDKLNACRLANAAHADGRKAAEKHFKESKRFDELPVLKCSADALHGLLCSNYFWAVSSYPRMGCKIHNGEVGAIFAILERDRDGKQYWKDFFIMHFIARVVLDKKVEN